MTRRTTALLPTLALVLGVALLAITVLRVDFGSIRTVSWQLGATLPLSLAPGALWHLLRTAAWQRCFPAGQPSSFARLFRVRLAAEAFSFVTIRGIAGEPLKVALLGDVPPAVSAAAVALERVAYLAVTTLLVGLAAGIALLTLPLSGPWMRIFRVLAVVSAVLLAGLVAVLVRRETPTVVPSASSPVAAGRLRRGLGRFGREVRLRWRELVYGDRRRFLGLVALESAAFAMMALEVWVVFWAVGAPISAAAATAIETVTRVVSMLSAFIPAGVGALEASNVAAAAAVHATAGAAALAIVRRLRGLIWCAAGFAIAPGAGRRSPATPAVTPPQSPGPPIQRTAGKHTLVVIDGVSACPAVSLSEPWGGLPVGERILRAAVHAGYERVLVWAPSRQAQWDAIARRHAGPLHASIIGDAAEWSSRVRAFEPDGIDTCEVPLTHEALVSAEETLRASIIKPTDGRLARFNRRLSIPISVWLIRRMRLSANAMSVFVLGLGLYAGWLFGRGDYVSGVMAAVISLAASILDGCDGELARLQYTQSAFGCWLDTLGDYVYYLATFVGLTVGAAQHSHRMAYAWLGVTLLAGTLLTFWLLIVLRHRATEGHPERLHARTKAHFQAGKPWARLMATLSTCATRATMPYGILGFALLGLLPVVLVLGAIGAHVYWISLAVKLRGLLPGAGGVANDGAAGPTPAHSV